MAKHALIDITNNAHRRHARSRSETCVGDCGDSTLITQTETALGWDFLGSLPVPVRQIARESLARHLQRHGASPSAPLKACFPLGQGGANPFDHLTELSEPRDWPGMVMAADDELLFHAAAQQSFGKQFVAVQPTPPRGPLETAGLVDPVGQIGVFAVAPFVWLVDERRLDGRPIPDTWADLLDARYTDQIVLGGWSRPGAKQVTHFNRFILLTIHELFGDDGVRALARNVSTFLHSAQMPRIAGQRTSAGGIYVLPLSLADWCPRRDVTRVVWPNDGALAYPLWSMVQRGAAAKLADLIEYVRGPELGALLNRNRYPSLCPDLPSVLPAGARLWWPGWEAVRDPGSSYRRARACDTFFANWKGIEQRPHGTVRCA